MSFIILLYATAMIAPRAAFKLSPMCARKRLSGVSLNLSCLSRAVSSASSSDSVSVRIPKRSSLRPIYNLRGVRGEVIRQSQKILKKVKKHNDDTSSNVVQCGTDSITALRTKLSILNNLSTMLESVKSLDNEAFTTEITPILHSLDIKLSSPPPAPVKKAKPAPVAAKKPYYVYVSADGLEIWAGKGAAQNDELSTDPRLRDNNEWWLHAAGHAGSHVVIKCTDSDLPTKYRQTVLDAAYLAAIHSKAAASAGKVKVSLTRCRNVSKARGAPAGQVQLTGEVLSISLNLKSERERSQRLVKVVNV